MDLTPFAQWLNHTFATYDYTILSALHHLATVTGGAATPFFVFVSLLAEKGIGMLLLGIILFLFKKTRKIGFCILGAVVCGGIITNVLLKDFIARPRPFVDINGIYHTWWQFVGAHKDTEFSFPSGHTTATMAAMTAIFLNTNKKKSWTCFLFVVLMGISRNYLMMHYPSDILGGIIAGGIGACIAFFIVKAIYFYLKNHPNFFISKIFFNFDLLMLPQKK